MRIALLSGRGYQLGRPLYSAESPSSQTLKCYFKRVCVGGEWERRVWEITIIITASHGPQTLALYPAIATHLLLAPPRNEAIRGSAHTTLELLALARTHAQHTTNKQVKIIMATCTCTVPKLLHQAQRAHVIV